MLANIAGCRDADGKGGTFNYGGYCNQKVEDLAKQILVETDAKKRDDLIFEAFTIVHEEVGLASAASAGAGLGRDPRRPRSPSARTIRSCFYWVQKQD